MHNAETINDLVKINNDRVAGYEKASLQTTDETLQTLFSRFAHQSGRFIQELRPLLKAEGEDPATGTTLAGKIYRLWMDFKVTFAGENQESLVMSCLMGENAAVDSYESALEDNELHPEERSLIEQQKVKLEESYNIVKGLLTTAAVK